MSKSRWEARQERLRISKRRAEKTLGSMNGKTIKDITGIHSGEGRFDITIHTEDGQHYTLECQGMSCQGMDGLEIKLDGNTLFFEC